MYTSENSFRAADSASADRSHIESERDPLDSNLRTAMLYLIISIALAAAGAIYEHFSFGVYSNFMIYAFAFPLIGGTLLYMLRYIRSLTGSQASGSSNELQTADLSWTWHAGIATFTVGSIVHGILAISGRPNSLTIVYLAAGTALLICAVIQAIKNRRVQQQTSPLETRISA